MRPYLLMALLPATGRDQVIGLEITEPACPTGFDNLDYHVVDEPSS